MQLVTLHINLSFAVDLKLLSIQNERAYVRYIDGNFHSNYFDNVKKH